MKGKRKSSESLMETDVSWEQAVEKARGMPDGAQSEEEMDHDTEKQMEVGEEESGDKPKKAEKAKKKSLNIISKTAKKLKKITGKQDDSPKGQKRKREEGNEEDDAEKKVKPEHMKKKDRKNMRKMTESDHYEIANRSKALWNELRRMDLPREKRIELSNELYNMVEGKAKSMIFAHDTSRVIQCLIKYGTQEHKNAIFEELKGSVVDMCKSKYSKFFVRKLLKYGTKTQRTHVFQSMYGNVRKLIRHKEACEIVEVAYNDYANAQQRSALIEEFYGPSFALFKTGEVRSLEQIIESNPDKRDAILSNMKESLAILVEKTVLQYSIVHRVFLDYFTHATPKLRQEMIEVVREGLIHMLHTRDGARVAMICLWHGTAKDRKVIVKSMKTFVLKVCKEEYGHMVLLAMFDSVDDTKIVFKVVLEEMLKSVHEVANDQFGRKVLLYLLSPRDSRHFHPDVLKVLKQGDDNIQSKKEASVRRQELLEQVSRLLVQYVAQHAKELAINNACLILILTIITCAKTDPTEAMRAVALLATEPFTSGKEHIIEHTAGHLTLKRLIKNDAERMKQGQAVLFSSILLDVLPDGALKTWAACNRGCFTLCCLIELKNEDVTPRVQAALGSLKSSLKKMEFKGAQLLLSKLT